MEPIPKQVEWLVGTNARQVAFLQELNLNPEEVPVVDLEAEIPVPNHLDEHPVNCCSRWQYGRGTCRGSITRSTCGKLFLTAHLY